MDDGNSVTTKLLTLLNVSATKIGKRKRVDKFVHSETKLNKRARSSITFEHLTSDTEKEDQKLPQGEKETVNSAEEGDDVEDEEIVEVDETEGTIPPSFSFRTDPRCGIVEQPASSTDEYENHFGLHPLCLSESSRLAVDAHSWNTSRERAGKLGSVLLSVPQNSEKSGPSSSACMSNIDVGPFYPVCTIIFFSH